MGLVSVAKFGTVKLCSCVSSLGRALQKGRALPYFCTLEGSCAASHCLKMVPQRWPVKSVSRSEEAEHPATAMEEGLV